MPYLSLRKVLVLSLITVLFQPAFAGEHDKSDPVQLANIATVITVVVECEKQLIMFLYEMDVGTDLTHGCWKDSLSLYGG